jgi:hypothetical protein
MVKRILVLFLILSVLSINAASAQSEPEVEILASALSDDGMFVALALRDEVLIFDMDNSTSASSRFPSSNTTALDFSSDRVRYEDGEAIDMFRVAIANYQNVTILQTRTLEVLHIIDQPATALVWNGNLTTGFEDTVYIYDAAWYAFQGGSLPPLYNIEDSFILPDVEGYEDYENTSKEILGLYELDYTHALLIRWSFVIDYGNHGHIIDSASVWDVSDIRSRGLENAPSYVADLLRQLEEQQFSEDGERLLIGSTWINLESGQVVELPLD